MSNTAGPDFLLQSASRLREQGRYAEAAKQYQAVVRATPQSATSWYNLGFCQRMSGQYDEALASYQQAIDRNVTQPEEAHLNRAAILADAMRREDEAQRELKRALKINPRYTPALINLANLAEDYGRRSESAELYARALNIEPSNWEALARYANVLVAPDDVQAAIPRLQAAVARRALADVDRANLGFALGRLLDLDRQYDAAFDAYAAANVASRSAYGGAYDHAAEDHLAARIMKVFADVPELPGQSSEWAPIFICGMFRSGSTLAEQVLAGHPRVSPCGELSLMPELVAANVSPFPEQAVGLDAGAIAALAEAYKAKIASLFPKADIVTDKWLSNFLYVGLIKRMFPRAKIVHTVREPLDNALSVHFLHLDSSFGYATDLMDTAHQLLLTRRLMAHWQVLYPDDVISFDYDEFVREPRAAAQALIAALGLEWDEECLAFHRRRNAVKTASVWQVREPLYTTSSGRWKNYAAHLEAVRDYLAKASS